MTDWITFLRIAGFAHFADDDSADFDFADFDFTDFADFDFDFADFADSAVDHTLGIALPVGGL
jgi:hypothetical protein